MSGPKQCRIGILGRLVGAWNKAEADPVIVASGYFRLHGTLWGQASLTDPPDFVQRKVRHVHVERHRLGSPCQPVDYRHGDARCRVPELRCLGLLSVDLAES